MIYALFVFLNFASRTTPTVQTIETASPIHPLDESPPTRYPTNEQTATVTAYGICVET